MSLQNKLIKEHGDLSCNVSIGYPILFSYKVFTCLPLLLKKFSIYLRELGATTEKYIRSKYLLKNPVNSFTSLKLFIYDKCSPNLDCLLVNQGVVSRSMSGEIESNYKTHLRQIDSAYPKSKSFSS